MDRDEIAADVLRSCHTQLKKALSPRDHVVDHLYQAKIISLEEKVRVQDQRLQQSQADELLMILAGRCTWAIVQELIKALEDATLRSQHELADWLKSQLRSKGVQNGRTSATPEPEVPTDLGPETDAVVTREEGETSSGHNRTDRGNPISRDSADIPGPPVQKETAQQHGNGTSSSPEAVSHGEQQSLRQPSPTLPYPEQENGSMSPMSVHNSAWSMSVVASPLSDGDRVCEYPSPRRVPASAQPPPLPPRPRSISSIGSATSARSAGSSRPVQRTSPTSSLSSVGSSSNGSSGGSGGSGGGSSGSGGSGGGAAATSDAHGNTQLYVNTPMEVGARYQADRDYTAKRPGCLSVQQDEIVTLREVTDTGWWKIKNGRGKVGWVPGFLWERAQAFAEDTANMGAERVCPPIYQLLVRGIVREPWFFSDITRDQGEAILHSYGKNNAFLVRTSQSAGNGLALAVYYDGEVDTFKIDVKANGHLKVGEMQFETMKVLIRYYTQHPVVAEDNRRVFLGEPAKRQ
eukprot:scpid52701/ scgid2893/ Cytoplasmic protein NCK1; NCK adaptor protein 1; SH2/SH3 adaptor protein NCK-alpha